MKTEIKIVTIGEIIELYENNMLSPNFEYQRGPVWNDLQKKKLIDSVLRGYPLPLIYLHHKRRQVGNFQRDDFEIIDGQQRVNTLFNFKQGNFQLLDPKKDALIAKFPNFITNADCSWANKRFDDLDEDIKELFTNTKLNVAYVYTDNDDEARDLFIRLQAGLPLNSQEKRDAWPGGFTEFILKFGGKPQIARYPGHDFFNILIKKKSTERGEIRQLCAQIAMLLFEDAKKDNWLDIGSPELDDYYYKNIDFNPDIITNPKVKRFREILDKITVLLNNNIGNNKLSGHEAISLVLFVDSLWDDYTRSWEDNLADAFKEFRKKLNEERIKLKRNKDDIGEFILNYQIYTETRSQSSTALKIRHSFFTQKMLEYLNPILLDPIRTYGQLEREYIYYRDKGKCFYCNGNIKWEDLDIHHVEQYSTGGKTTLENGKSVHRHCHHNGIHA